MLKRAWVALCDALVSTVFIAGLALVLAATGAAAAGLSADYGRLPLHFEENRGQVDLQVRFLARGPGYGLYLTSGEAVLALGAKDRAVLRMALVGANSNAQVSGLDELPGKANYFIGKDPAKWRTNVPTYAKVRYRGVYPGIDLVYYGNQRQLEYDFVVARGADPRRIALRFAGAEKLEIDGQGDLVLHLPQGNVRVKRPVVYQSVDGKRQEIDGRYVVRDEDRVGFQLAAYDSNKTLVIDPIVLSYSTFLGGNGFDGAAGIAVDGLGHAYVTGFTTSTNFPVTAEAFGTAFHGPAGSLSDVFVAKFDRPGTGLIYATYLGGSNQDEAGGIAVDSGGSAYVTGITHSADFPVTAGAFQAATDGSGDAFVTRLNSAGSGLVYSTYLGGSQLEGGAGIAADDLGNAYVTGSTSSTNFPTSVGTFQPLFAGGSSGPSSPGPSDAFVSKLGTGGSGLVYSTYLGGSGDDYSSAIAIDAAGGAYVTGRTNSLVFPTTPAAYQPLVAHTGDFSGYNAFVTKLDPAGATLTYSTYLGGSGADSGFGIAVDGGSNVYVTGLTTSINFPTTVGAVQPTFRGVADAFVTKLNRAGSALIYATFLGGSGADRGHAIAVAGDGSAHVAGGTESVDFPATADAVQASYAGGSGSAAGDAFVAMVHPGGASLRYSTYLGGAYGEVSSGIAVDPAGGTYVTGITKSPDFPTANAFQPVHAGGPPVSPVGVVTDAFVAKIVNEP